MKIYIFTIKTISSSIVFWFFIANCLLFTANSFAQGEANWWYFGYNAGLDFNGGAPAAVTNGQLNTEEGCASISDASGNLLFYTDGIKVWNKNHVQMPNGFGLRGHSSSTQSAGIIQKPGSAAIYYIFTADAQANANGIRYSEVDMSLNAGLGDITTNKNILLKTPSCEKITALRHCNNQDVWVLTHDWNSNAFRTYLVTASGGVNTIPVMSNAGLVVSGNTLNTQGQLKGSPDGKKLASTINYDNRFELFDFDNSTGIVSNAILFPQFSTITNGAYGVEFSPDGTKMYGTLATRNIYQFDLCAGSNTAIANSGVLIGTSSNNYNGSLQLGPNKKIYVARWNDSWVGVINSPNILGAGCNYVDNGVSLSGKKSSYGLPNFVPYYFKQAPPPFTVSDTCLTVTFTSPTVNITNCSGSTNAIVSVSWNFGDPASGANNTSTITNPTHTFTGAGTYTVTLVLYYACGNDTIQQNVTVVNCGITATTTSTNILCNGQCTGTATTSASGGSPSYTYAWSPSGGNNSSATGLCAGNYTVTVTDAASATTTATVTITQPTLLTATVTSTGATCGSNNGSATVTASGGTSNYTYSWNPSGQTTATATGLAAGIYIATVTDANGCTTTQTVNVPNANGPNVTLSQTNILCNGQCTGSSITTVTGGTSPYTYLWSNAQTASNAGNLCAGTYTVTVTDANNCTTTQTVTITQPTAALTATTNSIPAPNGTATVNPSGGTPPYIYLWNTIPPQITQTATGLVAGIYCCTITDANNCTDTVCVTITEPMDCSTAGELYLPNAFSPNGDGENDMLQLYYADLRCIKSIRLIIYDRWGEKVFKTSDPAFTWDGIYRNKLENTAVFVYYMEVTFTNGEKINKKGNISLMR